MAQLFSSLADKQLIELLKNGAVGIIPTDTVYGLICVATNTQAVDKLYALKSREHKPGTVIAAHIDQLVSLGLKYRYLKAAEQYWPAPISVVVPSGDPQTNYLRMGLPALAVRISAAKTLNKLINIVGPLLTSSANLAGQLPANTIKEAQNYFGDVSLASHLDVAQGSNEQRTSRTQKYGERAAQVADTAMRQKHGEVPGSAGQQGNAVQSKGVDFYVDGGDLSGREPSTIIRVVDDAVEVLRPGAVKINEKGEIDK
jgi:L-threonylcarbamoyladenylate synthase